MIQLESSDGHRFDVYENKPDDATSSIVVVQEILGVNPHIRSVVDRFADAGYHAMAPATFDRGARGVELEYDADGIEQGRNLAMGIGFDAALRDIGTSVDYASGTGPVGIVGYCFGGSMAWLAAAQLSVVAAVGHYGSQIPQSLESTPRAPVMLHFGELDKGIPLDGVAEIELAHPAVAVHVYEGAEHGFNCDARSSFHPEAASLAQKRTMDFFASHLASNRAAGFR